MMLINCMLNANQLSNGYLLFGHPISRIAYYVLGGVDKIQNRILDLPQQLHELLLFDRSKMMWMGSQM